VFDQVRAIVLRWMRVPHDPEPPAGAPQSVRVFRASENFYKFRLVGWTITQVVGVAGIVFWIWMIGQFERRFDEARRAAEFDARAQVAAAASRAAAPQTPVAATSSPSNPAVVSAAAPNPPKEQAASKNSRRNRYPTGQLARRVPPWAMWVIRVFELFGIAGFIAQLPVTLAALRLDYELRWYIVTDRSLRIRSGIWRVQEMTMSFANIQQVAITRGPIQGLLKISDVRVQSAGGGGGDPRHGRGDSLHCGIFHGVGNASEIRDLILERLRLFRAAGLGDPDDAHERAHAASPAPEGLDAPSALAAAQEVLAEARALRAIL
jgi:hypothetical protein